MLPYFPVYVMLIPSAELPSGLMEHWFSLSVEAGSVLFALCAHIVSCYHKQQDRYNNLIYSTYTVWCFHNVEFHAFVIQM